MLSPHPRPWPKRQARSEVLKLSGLGPSRGCEGSVGADVTRVPAGASNWAKSVGKRKRREEKWPHSRCRMQHAKGVLIFNFLPL